jgi:hypothetical protein
MVLVKFLKVVTFVSIEIINLGYFASLVIEVFLQIVFNTKKAIVYNELQPLVA